MKNKRLENIKWLLSQPKISAKLKILNLKNYIDYEIKSDIKNELKTQFPAEVQ